MSCELSVIVPTYRRAALLRRCLGSILAEPSQDMEVLVADNASPDCTPSVLASFSDRRLKHWRQDVNVGVEKNILSLLKAAQGKWIFCITDDDYVLPGGLERLVSVARENPSIGVILSAARVVDIDGNYIRTYHFHENAQHFKPGLDALLGLVEPSHVLSRIMMRREWIDLAGMEETLGSLYPQMYAVGSVLREHGGAYLDECIVAHTIGNATDWDYPIDFMVGPRIALIKYMLPVPRWRAERGALLSQLRDDIAKHHMPLSLRKSVQSFLGHQRVLLKYPEIAFSPQYWRGLLCFVVSTSWQKARESIGR